MTILIEHDALELKAEADHRIANNLASLGSVVRLQRAGIARGAHSYTTEQVCTLLDDISARVEVMARLHKSLATCTVGNGVNLGDFLHDICEMISTLGSAGSMELTIDHSCEGYIEPRHALHTGLIIAELLTNARKYAHPAGLPVKVDVRCETKSDGSFMVQVTDDGIGFPEKFNPATDGGLGFQLMRALANALQAELQFEHNSLGVCARVIKSQYLAS